MNLKELIIQLVAIALFFAFPTIWYWLVKLIPWWPLDPQSTLNILIFIAVTAVTWFLGIIGIRRVIKKTQETQT